MLFLNPVCSPFAERVRASTETAPASARAPQVTFAQVVTGAMDRAQVRPPPQAEELVAASGGADPTIPEDDAGLPDAPDAPETLQGDTPLLPAPGHSARAGHDLPLQDDLSILLQVVPAAGRDQSVSPRTAPLSAVGDSPDSPVLAAAAASAEGIAAYPFAQSREALGPKATHSTLGSVPENSPSAPLGPMPEGVSTSFALPLAQPFRGESAAPFATDSGPAPGAKVGDVGIIVPHTVPTMQLSPDSHPPDAMTLNDQIALPQPTAGMRDASRDHGTARYGSAHSAHRPVHLPLPGAKNSALPVAAATLPAAAQAPASRDSIADPLGTRADTVRAKTVAPMSPNAPHAAFGEADSFDRMTILRDPVPVSDAQFAPVPGGQTPQRQPVLAAPVPVQQIPLPPTSIERRLAGPPMPHAPAVPRVADQAAPGQDARQAATEKLAVPLLDATPGTEGKAITDATVQAVSLRVAPTRPSAMTIPPSQPPQAMVFQADSAAYWAADESPAAEQVARFEATQAAPAAMTVPPPPASQAVALQPAMAAPWPAAASPAPVQPPSIGAMPTALAAMAIAPPPSPQAVALQPTPTAHRPVASSPSEPVLASSTSIAPPPLPAGIAAYAADRVDWHIQRLYVAVPDRVPNPTEPVPAIPREDAMLPRAVTAEQGMPGPQNTALSATPSTAQAVIRQVLDPFAQGVQRGQSGQITVHLSPAELGRVEIAMQPREAGMALIILAERPEVLELLRRHIDQLADDMRALGYSDLSFQFGAGTDRRSAAASGLGQNDDLPDTGASPTAPPAPAIRLANARHDGRLDLRF